MTNTGNLGVLGGAATISGPGNTAQLNLIGTTSGGQSTYIESTPAGLQLGGNALISSSGFVIGVPITGNGTGLTNLNDTNVFYKLTNTFLASEGYVLQYHGGALQWINTNWMGAGGGGGGGSYSFSHTTNINMLDGSLVNTTIAHGLGSVPSILKGYLVCSTNDASTGYAVGRRIPIECVQNAGHVVAPFTMSADATDIYISQTPFSGNGFTVTTAGGYAALNGFGNYQIVVVYGP
jgi:hypothetical protein